MSAREWRELGSRDIDHRTRGARVRAREAIESSLSEFRYDSIPSCGRDQYQIHPFESVLLVKVAFPYKCYRAKTFIGTTMNKMDTLACCIALLGCNGNAIAFAGEEAKADVIAQEKAWSD